MTRPRCTCTWCSRSRCDIETASSVTRRIAPEPFDHTAPADLTGQAGKALEAVDVFRIARIGYRELLGRVRLRGAQESEKLRHVERVGAIEIRSRPGDLFASVVGRRGHGNRRRRDGDAARAGHVAHDQGCKPSLADVGVRAHHIAPFSLRPL